MFESDFYYLPNKNLFLSYNSEAKTKLKNSSNSFVNVRKRVIKKSRRVFLRFGLSNGII